jgi:hypothetical protein
MEKEIEWDREERGKERGGESEKKEQESERG